MRRKFSSSSESSCHSGPIEVVRNLYCGNVYEALAMASPLLSVDTLIPLHELSPDIWSLGFRGEVLYFPIRDFGVLPDDVLDNLVSGIIDRLHSGKKVGLFCLGGHGRTGYVAAVVLGRMGHKDPIAFLRANYCRLAIESGAQIQHIAKMLGNPLLAEKNASRYDCDENHGGTPRGSGLAFARYGKERYCRECVYFYGAGCLVQGDFDISRNDYACRRFEDG